jgi:hypothetical protein
MGAGRGGPLGAAFAILLLGLVVGCGSGASISAPAATPGMTSTPSANPSATFTPLPSPQGAALTLASFTLSGGEQNVLPAGTVASPYVPDEQMPYLRQPAGTFKVWASAGGTYGTYLFATPDLLSLGAPATVFLPAGAGTPAFDADYAGPGSIFPAANGTDLLMIYHAENHLFGGVDYPGTPFYAGIGLARSSDGGVTWQRQGEIISGHDPQPASQPPSGAGALTPSAIEIGGYIYVCFREIDLQSGVSGYALARAPLSGDGAPGNWEKYYQGTFSSPGLGGAFTPLNIVLDPTVPGDQRQPNISFNVYLNAFVMITIGNGGIYALTSPDLITWSAASLVLAATVPDAMAGSTNGPRNWYPTLMSPDQPSDEITDRTGFLYYAKFLGDGTSHHYMYRQGFTIASSTPQSKQRK